MRGVLALVLALAAAPALSAPPHIEARGLFERGLVRGRWQPIRVTIVNPPDGAAVRGEVQVAVEDARRGHARMETYARGLSLPPGAGRAEVPVTVRVPEDAAAELTVYVTNRRQVIARKRLDQLPVIPEPLGVLAAEESPDALAYLRGRDLGLVRREGVLRLAEPPLRWWRGNFRARENVEVIALVPGHLPDRSADYDAVRIVYLGDLAPDALSDAQIAALRGWTAAGGLLVVGGPRLLADPRLGPWLPARLDPGVPPAVTAAGITVRALVAAPGARRFAAHNIPAVEGRVGRGVAIALGIDAADAAFAGDPGAMAVWRSVAARGVLAGPSLIGDLEDERNAWPAGEFFASVLRAPNLRAPAFGWIGLFLLAYLVLLVPVNYAILRRLDRREWTWLSVPALVLIFSIGAYGFGYAVKGGRMRLNTATVTELGSGDGRGRLLASVGLFSPRRASYDVTLAGADALLFGPRLAGRVQTESTPLVIGEQDNSVRAQGADVAMWAMRVLGARTTTEAFGAGLRVRLARGPGGNVTGTLENRTGRSLDGLTVYANNKSRRLGALPAGATAMVRLTDNDPDVLRHRNGFRLPLADWNARPPRTTHESIRWNVQTALNNLQNIRWANGARGAPAPVVVTAWNYDPLLPLRVDGRAVPGGDHVNFLIVHAPLF